jgi:hypothetical protein
VPQRKTLCRSSEHVLQVLSLVVTREEPVIRARLARRRREAHWYASTDDNAASRDVGTGSLVVHRSTTGPAGMRGRLPAALEAAYDEAVLAVCLEVRQQLRDRLPDDASPVDRDAMLGAQDQPRMLKAEQLVG